MLEIQEPLILVRDTLGTFIDQSSDRRKSPGWPAAAIMIFSNWCKKSRIAGMSANSNYDFVQLIITNSTNQIV